ncbi:hypothetical protein EDD17DRAFT_1589329 [Pisolithus thermaeus]|nr:hypothetical protein EDD17DRAFT_1589329 [Pisolithus thermaeus]
MIQDHSPSATPVTLVLGLLTMLWMSRQNPLGEDVGARNTEPKVALGMHLLLKKRFYAVERIQNISCLVVEIQGSQVGNFELIFYESPTIMQTVGPISHQQDMQSSQFFFSLV